MKEAHSKTLEELTWKHHTAIEAAHSNANKDKKKLQMVGLFFLNNQTYSKKKHKYYNLSLVLHGFVEWQVLFGATCRFAGSF